MNKKWLMKRRKQLRASNKRNEVRINALASIEDRDLTEAETAEWDTLTATVEKNNRSIEGIDEKLTDAVIDEDEDSTEDSEEGNEDEDEDGDEDENPPVRSRRPAAATGNRGRSGAMRGITPGSPPAVHTQERTFSYLAACRASYEMVTQGRAYSGVEAEVHNELTKARRALGVVEPPRGILIPLGTEPSIERLVWGKRGRMNGPERRDFTLTTGVGNIYTKMQMPLVDLLRSQLVLTDLGARFLTDLQGPIGFTRQTGATTAYFAGESVPVSLSNPTTDQFTLSPKLMTAISRVSRALIYQSSIDAEQMVKDDLAAVTARKLENVAFNGPGGTSPLGILGNTAVTTFSSAAQIGTNGGIPTWAQIIKPETLIRTANAGRDSIKWATTPGMVGILKTTPKIGSTFPTFIFGDDGKLNTYPVLTSTEIPGNLTKGTSAGICHAMIFANWNDLMIGQWGGVDTLVNPYSDQEAGDVKISMYMNVDVQVRHAESFVAIKDALAA